MAVRLLKMQAALCHSTLKCGRSLLHNENNGAVWDNVRRDGWRATDYPVSVLL